jgi:hypothetical protein
MTTTKKTYDYRPIQCPNCGWRGNRSLFTRWPACPKCNAFGGTLLPIEKSPAAVALIDRHEAEANISEEALRCSELREQVELARLKAKYE